MKTTPASPGLFHPPGDSPAVVPGEHSLAHVADHGGVQPTRAFAKTHAREHPPLARRPRAHLQAKHELLLTTMIERVKSRALPTRAERRAAAHTLRGSPGARRLPSPPRPGRGTRPRGLLLPGQGAVWRQCCCSSVLGARRRERAVACQRPVGCAEPTIRRWAAITTTHTTRLPKESRPPTRTLARRAELPRPWLVVVRVRFKAFRWRRSWHPGHRVEARAMTV
jgi:hypothetical protein